MVAKVDPLVVIVGPTASGKTALALELARRYNGEIICADSRTVYKGMDIGTAKPSSAERAEIPHHIIDIVAPDQTFTAAEFKRRALIWIDDITIRGKLPIMVGGTGLYIDGVIFDYAFLPPVPPEERAELEAMSIEQLQAEITSRGIAMPENSKNKRYLVRALETNGEIPVRKGLRRNTLIIGLEVGREELKGRLTARVNEMVENGFIDEVKALGAKYGWNAPGLQAPGYKAFRQYIEHSITLDEAKNQFVQNDFALAKRQRTWFRRNPQIQWFASPASALAFISNWLIDINKTGTNAITNIEA